MKNKKFGTKNQRLVLTRKQPNKTTEQKPSPSDQLQLQHCSHFAAWTNPQFSLKPTALHI